jgi:hypothetical protein
VCRYIRSKSVFVASAWYNFACGTAIAGRHDEALEYPGQAIDHGFPITEQVLADPDLKSLHGASRFGDLVAKARHSIHATAQKKAMVH